VSGKDHGLFQPGKPGANAFVDYSNLAATMLHANGLEQGLVRYWDQAAGVPYLYNANTRVFVSYDDPQSVLLKCRFTLTHHLAGVMFWTYESDSNGALLNTVDAALLHGKK
jgi:chitinase